MNGPIAHLANAEELAHLLIEQIEYVDLLDEVQTQQMEQWVREEGVFCEQATPWIRLSRQRRNLHQVLRGMCRILSINDLALRLIDPQEVPAACELVTSALKGLMARYGHPEIRARKLILKFTSIESPWIQTTGGTEIVRE
jgi:hypothetical protein